MGWWEFDCSTVYLILLGLVGIWQKWLSIWARWWNIPNKSQPNPGWPGDVSPCTYNELWTEPYVPRGDGPRRGPGWIVGPVDVLGRVGRYVGLLAGKRRRRRLVVVGLRRRGLCRRRNLAWRGKAFALSRLSQGFIDRADGKSQVRQCLGFCSDDS